MALMIRGMGAAAGYGGPIIAFSACDLGIEDPDESTCDVLVLIKLEDDLVAVHDPVEIPPHFAAVEFLRPFFRRQLSDGVNCTQCHADVCVMLVGEIMGIDNLRLGCRD